MKINNERLNIVIINTAFLGDVALSVYFCDKIKEIYPNSILKFITTQQASKIVESFASVDEVIPYYKRDKHKGFTGFKNIAEMCNNTDILFSAHRSFRSSILAKFIGSELSISYDKSSLSFLYNKRVPYQIELHEIDRNFLLLQPLIGEKISYTYEKAKLNFKVEDKNYIHDIINKYKLKDFICIAPASVWETKKWTRKGFQNLIKLLNENDQTPVLIGGKQDKELCENIIGDQKAINLSGETSLAQTMILLSYAKKIVSNDSAPTHLAGLVGTPVITIFGPTAPIFGFAPHGKNDTVIENNELKCRPCSAHGSIQCPIGTFECMNSITAEMVYEKVIK